MSHFKWISRTWWQCGRYLPPFLFFATLCDWLGGFACTWDFSFRYDILSRLAIVHVKRCVDLSICYSMAPEAILSFPPRRGYGFKRVLPSFAFKIPLYTCFGSSETLGWFPKSWISLFVLVIYVISPWRWGLTLEYKLPAFSPHDSTCLPEYA